MATLQEATDLYERAIAGMQEVVDRIEKIEELPWWNRAYERRRLDRIFYAFDRHAQALGDAIEEGLNAAVED